MEALSSVDDWSTRWDNAPTHTKLTRIEPSARTFRETHSLFQKHLPKGDQYRFLEVGSFPGTYMRYFHEFFGYQVTGLEYVSWCCEEQRRLFKENNIPCEVIEGDINTWQLPEGDEGYDIVSSFGLIEHFDDTREIIQNHWRLVKPGGFLILSIPNHAGVNGPILKMVDREAWGIHNKMPFERMEIALKEIDDTELVEGGYYNRFGFGNTGLYRKLRELGKAPYYALKSPFWLLENCLSWLPNCRLLSQNSASVIRKVA